MNDLIKFRYWNTISNIMVNEPHIRSGVMFSLNEYFSERGWIWLQYTGIKDKNGKEIYFGDILDYEDVDGGGEHFQAKVVRTICGGAGVQIDYEISDLWEDEGVHKFEIIGNEFENKELNKQFE